MFVMRLVSVALILTLGGLQAAHADPLTLDQALSQALSENPEIAAQASLAKAQHSAIASRYSLENPTFGLMRESNMNFMEQQMGPMDTWSISQAIQFPTKYFLMGSEQSSKAKAADQELSAKRLEIRQKLISAYYNLFSVNRVIALLEAQRETLHEVARSAESRHAVGAVPQQDEMKAHVEETKIEADLISTQEEQAMAEASLNALMNREANEEIPLPKEELPVPKLNASISEIEKTAYQKSRQVKAAQYAADSADTAKNLAAWGFAPDFMLTYRKAFVNAPPNAYSFEVALSIPLWFFAKQTGDYRTAIAESAAAEKKLELVRVNTSAEVKSLVSKVISHEKLLEIYQTSLIPQASTSLSSSRGAYQAGRTGFLELLDSERSLYAVRIAYYRTLSQYVDYLTQLEQVVGTRLSSLPMGGSL